MLMFGLTLRELLFTILPQGHHEGRTFATPPQRLNPIKTITPQRVQQQNFYQPLHPQSPRLTHFLYFASLTEASQCATSLFR